MSEQQDDQVTDVAAPTEPTRPPAGTPAVTADTPQVVADPPPADAATPAAAVGSSVPPTPTPVAPTPTPVAPADTPVAPTSETSTRTPDETEETPVASAAVAAPGPLRLRRAPRYRPFGLTGALIGVIAGIVLALSFTAGANYTMQTIAGYFAAIFGLLGAVLGLGLAVLIERRQAARAGRGGSTPPPS